MELQGPRSSIDLHRLARRLGGVLRCTERGASLVEYALLIVLIAVVMIGAVTMLGEAASSSIDGSSSSILDATS